MEKKQRVSLESTDKLYNSTRKYHYHILKNGEEIRYFNKFSQNKINKLLKELGEMIDKDQKQMVKLFTSEEFLFQFSYFLIIKYFTDLGKEFPEGYENNILLFNKMIELELFTEIINILPAEEVSRVLEEIIERAKLGARVMKEQEKALEIVELKKEKENITKHL